MNERKCQSAVWANSRRDLGKPYARAYLDIKSGTEVPAARNVYPITTSLIPATAPTEVAHHTMK